MERLVDTRRARRWASTASSCAGATTSSPRRCRTRPPSGMQLRQRRFPGRARPGARARRLGRLRRAQARRAAKRGKLRGLGIGQYLEVTAPPSKEMGGIRFEADGDRHDHHRHARLRPGPRLAVRAGADASGSASRSSGSAAAGRQRRADRRRRHRRLELDAWRAAPRSSRPRDQVIEKGKQIAGACAGSRGRATSSSSAQRPLHHRRHRPRHRHHGAGRAAARRAASLPPDVPHTLDVQHVIDERAVGLPERLPCRRGRDRPRDRRGRGGALHDRSTISA